MTELELKIKEASQKYYEGSSIMEDDDFDKLIVKLKLENPESKLLKSPGFGYVPSKNKFQHISAVGGLNKLRDLSSKSGKFWVMPKYDGISASIYLINDEFKLITRGNGIEGVDISYKFRKSLNKLIGTALHKDMKSGIVESIKGEILMRKSIFEESYSDKYKNCRNTVAGLMNSQDLINESDFDIIIYGLTTSDSVYNSTGSITYRDSFVTDSSIQIAKQYEVIEINSNTDKELEYLFEFWNKDHLLDGVVLHGIDNSDDIFAFKFSGETEESEVVGISWKVSEYGKVVPTVLISPIQLSGVTISRVAGNSYEFLKSNDIIIGSKVTVIRSGEVIPYILDAVLPESYDGEFNNWINYPEDVIQSGAHLYKELNREEILYNNIRKLIQVGRRFSKIEGIGGAMLNKFAKLITDNKLIDIETPIFELVGNDFESIKTLLTKREHEFLVTVLSPEHIYKVPYDKALAGLAPEGIGLSKVNKYLTDSNYNPEGLEDLHNTYFAYRSAAVLNDPSLVYEEEVDETPESEFKGNIVITGKLSKPRKQIEQDLVKLGYKIQGGINADTNYLLCNEPSTSSKYLKATELGVKIITESEVEVI